jgi:hypothetical protein
MRSKAREKDAELTSEKAGGSGQLSVVSCPVAESVVGIKH